MAAPPPPPLFLLLFFSLLSLSSAGHQPLPPAGQPASCAHAPYPDLCVRTLASSRLPTNTPADLARAAVSSSLSSTRDAAEFLSRLASGDDTGRGGGTAAPGALRDCREQLSDSADQLARTRSELARLRPATFRWQLDNALTWVSAAMTNEDTCLEGIQGGGGRRVGGRGANAAAAAPPGSSKEAVVRRVSCVSRVTSNALYFINRLASTRGRRGLSR